jgi:thioredoxin-like negative regulator of GroEL
MFRRRRLRPLRRARRVGPAAARPRRPVPEPVRRAMGLFEKGKFEEAAQAFEELAQGAEDRGMLFRAGNLMGQASRCYLELDDVDTAYDRGKKALDLFKSAERPAAARRVTERMVKALKDKGRQAEAEALERELKQMPMPARAAGRRGELPGKCSQCGGPIREAEATWVGPSSAECPYCGSVIKAE